MLAPEAAELLGRLLIDYQGLESAIRQVLDVAFEPIDPLGVMTASAKDLLPNRKIESALRILDLAARKYGVPKVSFTGKVYLMLLPEDPKSPEHVADAFAGMRDRLSDAKQLMDFRNKLFHGRVEAQDDELRFVIGDAGSHVRDAIGSFQEKIQQVRAVSFHLLLASNSMRVAMAYLVEASKVPDTVSSERRK